MITKINHDTNVWFGNEKPSLIERLLVKLFRVRIIAQKCDQCNGTGSNPKWTPDQSIFLIACRCKGRGVLLYLRRFYLSPRWKWLPFKIFLHHILLSDTDRAMHDHPFPFKTTLLKGSYKEHWLVPYLSYSYPYIEGVDRIAGQSRSYLATHVHRLDIIKPVWSFVIAGKTTREWGFHTDTGWKVWHEFLKLDNYNVYPEDEI